MVKIIWIRDAIDDLNEIAEYMQKKVLNMLI